MFELFQRGKKSSTPSEQSREQEEEQPRASFWSRRQVEARSRSHSPEERARGNQMNRRQLEARSRSNSPQEIARGSEWTREQMETRSRSRSPESTNTKSSRGKKKKYNYLKRKRDNRVNMSGIFINGNRKQIITNYEFDVMVEHMKAENDLVLQRMSEKVRESDDQLMRWKDDQKTYHQNYYNKNLKQPYTCEDCGRRYQASPTYPNTRKAKYAIKTQTPLYERINH